ncbi:hypothetical protein [Nevskia ramosa]|uniref:hypothetical protein n=1 Tax=Nevskia ramosa TaxID=64002 RepID=UPI003D0EC8AD
MSDANSNPMAETINVRVQRWCVWSGLIFLLLFGLGWIFLAGFIPPPRPDASGAQIAAFYQTDVWMKRLGLVIAQAACIFFVPWVCVISTQMRRIKGSDPSLAAAQLIGGSIAMLAVLIPTMIWTTVSFRPDRDPELMLLLNDLGWIILSMTFAPFLTQSCALAAAIFLDKGDKPVFPRWAAYLNIWVPMGFLPTALVVYFKSGPFGWNGLFGIYIPLANFAIWFFVMIKLLLDAIKQQESQQVRASSN